MINNLYWSNVNIVMKLVYRRIHLLKCPLRIFLIEAVINYLKVDYKACKLLQCVIPKLSYFVIPDLKTPLMLI